LCLCDLCEKQWDQNQSLANLRGYVINLEIYIENCYGKSV
jgi:hypothetical protein